MKILMSVLVVCPQCKGLGTVETTKGPVTCGVCRGSGTVNR